MTLGVIGKKVGMTQVFDKEGLAIPVTVVKLGDNIVTQKLTKEKNGYVAVQVGGFLVEEKKLNKPELGAFKKNSVSPVKPLQEYRLEDNAAYNVGENLPIDQILKEGMLVDVHGKTIGKGFQGTIKRYHAGRGPMSHGSKFHRSMGSIGAGTTPGRVFRGLHMPGQMGNKNHCIRHLKVVSVDLEKKVLLIKGAVPGSDGGLLTIKPSKTKWN
ncbi:MAG: 50S ribosomal protein L3 [Candidatus Obscuribacterales bacterium]|jgi:large subunit ribosomal protein L3|nr:50S ribosomal protein L3 [Cyanobacteria bacterium SZAS LIN-5]RTL44986.1 MAG: 50S ribosomal protein L3 [Candidatus Melainabacteria bacterium]